MFFLDKNEIIATYAPNIPEGKLENSLRLEWGKLTYKGHMMNTQQWTFDRLGLLTTSASIFNFHGGKHWSISN